jgi:hypothetical protein
MYRSVKTIPFGYKNPSVNAVQGHNWCLFWGLYKTHECAVWAERRVLECETWLSIMYPVGFEGLCKIWRQRKVRKPHNRILLIFIAIFFSLYFTNVFYNEISIVPTAFLKRTSIENCSEWKEYKFRARVTVVALPWQQAMSFGVRVIELGDLKPSRKNG